MARVNGSTGSGRMIMTTKAMFTMRHFKAMGATFRATLALQIDRTSKDAIIRAIVAQAAMFKTDNDRFSFKLFYAECGVSMVDIKSACRRYNLSKRQKEQSR